MVPSSSGSGPIMGPRSFCTKLQDELGTAGRPGCCRLLCCCCCLSGPVRLLPGSVSLLSRLHKHHPSPLLLPGAPPQLRS